MSIPRALLHQWVEQIMLPMMAWQPVVGKMLWKLRRQGSSPLNSQSHPTVMNLRPYFYKDIEMISYCHGECKGC